jgi:hypothetical protein
VNDRAAVSVSEHFASAEDPHMARTALHSQLRTLVIASCAVVVRSDDWLEWVQTVSRITRG